MERSSKIRIKLEASLEAGFDMNKKNINSISTKANLKDHSAIIAKIRRAHNLHQMY